jgi:transcriptional regulator with GAF, ATPase, and Fis domain
MSDLDGDAIRVRRERDLYRRLLDLGHTDALEPFLRDALDLIVEVTGARHGYLELHDDEDAGPRWWIAHGLTQAEIEDVRAAISRGIIAEAVAGGKTIVTQSALLDPRFGQRASVQAGRIEAVLCAPIGDDPVRGVVYLQRPAAVGEFTEEDRACAETSARHLAALADRVLARHRERNAADETAPFRAKLRLDAVIGRSAALAELLKQVALAAPIDVTLLLTGDNGTGKSQIARIIHDNGPRATGPFVTLNCAALPETLLESELFGALPGAHSTATRRIDGKVTAAEGGTLLLDEIGDLSLAAQAKLLHLLQSKEYYPLGGTRPVHANVRVIAATNVDLEQAVAERRFREDLYYRLCVLPVRVPSLAERRPDIPLLAAHFCRAACERHGFPHLEFSRNALRAVGAAAWPGNVRQLEHAVEAAVIRASGARAEQIERTHVFPEVAGVAAEEGAVTFQEATRRFQAEFLRDALEAHDWNVVETARDLDVARSHLYTLIRAFGLERR